MKEHVCTTQVSRWYKKQAEKVRFSKECPSTMIPPRVAKQVSGLMSIRTLVHAGPLTTSAANYFNYHLLHLFSTCQKALSSVKVK